MKSEKIKEYRQFLSNRTKNQSEIKNRMQQYLIKYINCVNHSSLKELLWLIVHNNHLPDEMKENEEELRDLAYGNAPKKNYNKEQT